MRVTNQMMTNSALINVNNNKNLLNKLEYQYMTGKKIQKPSDDPIIAVRALKLRTTVTEITQYYEKNIPDAKNWMDVTEGALTAISDIMGKINGLCVQGENDPLATDDRKSIVENLKQYREEIYKQGNSDYAGRYVFTGYKTDKSLIYDEKATDKRYTITQKFTADNLEITSQVTNGVTVPATPPSTLPVTVPTPELTQTYRLQLAYDNLTTTAPTISYTVGGTTSTITPTVMKSTDANAYVFTPATPPATSAPEAHYIADTGEIVFNDVAYKTLKGASEIKVEYEKSEFNVGEVRPENYFDCKTINLDNMGAPITGTDVTYDSADQQIQYDINYKQKLTINTQAKDAIKTDLGRNIDDIVDAIESLQSTETKIADVKKRLEDTTLTSDEKTYYNQVLEQLETERTLKGEKLGKAYASGIAISKEQQNVVNVANADLGSRYVRLQLVESRLDTQSDQVEELMSNNEDVDLAEIIIRYNSALNLYNSSLSATAKVLTNSLLDFI